MIPLGQAHPACEKGPGTEQPNTYTLTQYLQTPKPEKPAYLVDGLVLREGRVLLQGRPKEGKSTIGLQLACAIGGGVPFLGRDTIKGPTLYIQFDNTETAWREMLERGQDEGLSYDGVHLINPRLIPNLTKFDVRDLACRQWLLSMIVEVQPVLLVWDVFRKFHKSDENDSKAMTDVNNCMREVEQGRASVVLHHTFKFRDQDGMGNAVEPPDPTIAGRGSGVLAGDAETVWLLHKGHLYISPRFAEKETLTLKQTPNGFWSYTRKVDPEAQAVLQALITAHPGVSVGGLYRIDTLGMSRATFHRKVSQLGGLRETVRHLDETAENEL